MRLRSFVKSGIVRFIRHATQSTSGAVTGSNQLQTPNFTPFSQRFIPALGRSRTMALAPGSYPTTRPHFRQRELPKKITLPQSQVKRCMKT
jgi:hypothetical protein